MIHTLTNQSGKSDSPVHSPDSLSSGGDTGRLHTLRLILGDQLNISHSWFQKPDPEVLYLMAEQRSETDYVRHHAQKLIAVFSAMREFSRELSSLGHRLLYIRIGDPDNRQNFPQTIREIVQRFEIERFEWQRPDEYRLEHILRETGRELDAEFSISSTQCSSEHFLSEEADFTPLVKNGKPPTMERFYRKMRMKTGYLMADAEPLGGRWNYDADNRSPMKDGPEIPVPLWHLRNEQSLWDEILAAGVSHFGNPRADSFPWPLNRKQAVAALDDFIAHRFTNFGKYQDAMATGEPFVFHSLISFSLNVKLLSPAEVIERLLERWLDAARDDLSLLASLEGYIRQILGWREYMRQVYSLAMPEYSAKNALSASRRLPTWYWTGETDMNCLKQSIGQSLDYAYAHHIQRLMVTGNFAMMAGIDPAEVDAWYLGIYIDAFEWVEITNTRGMSQYADGGMVATKPYAASARYINKMSDYCRNCRFNQNKRHGEGACPFNSLYWHFLHRNRDVLGKNHRLAMPYKTWDRFDPQEQEAVLNFADNFLQQLK